MNPALHQHVFAFSHFSPRGTAFCLGLQFCWLPLPAAQSLTNSRPRGGGRGVHCHAVVSRPPCLQSRLLGAAGQACVVRGPGHPYRHATAACGASEPRAWGVIGSVLCLAIFWNLLSLHKPGNLMFEQYFKTHTRRGGAVAKKQQLWDMKWQKKKVYGTCLQIATEISLFLLLKRILQTKEMILQKHLCKFASLEAFLRRKGHQEHVYCQRLSSTVLKGWMFFGTLVMFGGRVDYFGEGISSW